jgi:hypothetical protein
MNKTNRILVVLFLVQVLLLMGMRFSGDEAVMTAPVKVFEGLEVSKITKLEIKGELKDDPSGPAQTSVTLAKEGATWGVANADNFPADQTKVEEFLEKLTKLKSRGAVLTRSVNHKKVEVADDRYQRKITLVHDGKELSFLLGSSPSFKNVHLRKVGGDDVVQVADFTSWEAGARAWDWVDRTYLKIPESNVYGVRIQNKNGTINLTRNVSGEWIADGVTGPVKKSVIDDLVRKASTINLEEPVGKTEKPEHGLDVPLATVTLTTGTSSIAGKMPEQMTTDVIKVGAKLDKDARYIVKASTSSYVVQVAAWAVEPLVNKTNKDLLDIPADPKDAANDQKKPSMPPQFNPHQ